MNDTSASTSQTTLLRELRLTLLHLHKSLLNMERQSFERTHGAVNRGELLQLVVNHPQFAWLRMISALVVEIDEMLDAEEQPADVDVVKLVTGAHQLFTSSENDEFRDKYQAALQREPEVVMAHSALMKLVRSKP